MVDKTLGEIITRCQRELSQVPGLAVQIYAQDALADKIEAAYLFAFDDTNTKWKRFLTFADYTLDGTTGRAVETVSTLFKSYEHIHSVFPFAYDTPLDKWSGLVNPNNISGSTPRQVTRDNTNVFRVFPLASTGKVTVVGRTQADLPFALNDTVPFDFLALTYFACWQYAIDDGSNPGAVEKFKALFDLRYKALRDAEQQEAVSLNPRRTKYPTQWEEL